MALSEEEQRLLEQMEAALSADDPKLANALRGSGVRRFHRPRAIGAGLGFLAGVVALIAGMETFPIISIAGFLIMLVSAVILLGSWQQFVSDHEGSAQSRPHSHSDSAFMDRLDERWRRHHDDGA